MDFVVENANEGTDAIVSTVTANVDALVLQGAGNISGMGNSLANSIFENTGALARRRRPPTFCRAMAATTPSCSRLGRRTATPS